MAFVDTEIQNVLAIMDQLDPNKKPLWGNLSAQGMIEHLTETLKIANGKKQFPYAIPEEKFEKMQAFLESDKPMAREIVVNFFPNPVPLVHEEIELAIDDYLLEWIDFETYFDEEGKTSPHPYYGPLNHEQWLKLHAKHLTHHFEQFGLLA